MNEQELLANIEDDMQKNRTHRKIMLCMVIMLGISTAFELYKASYWAVAFDILCVILASIDIALTEKEDQELISERQMLLDAEEVDSL